jgi:nucleotide-binding universal stress UspA family protein
MNDFKTLLLHLDAVPMSRSRLEIVKQLATAQGARIEVLYAVMPLIMQYPFALATDGYAAGELAQCQADLRDAAKAAFERESRAASLTDTVWRDTQDEPVRAFRDHAWTADLMVLSQHDPNAAAATCVRSDFVASVLVDTGKPGLVLPYIPVTPGFGQNVLVAWKATPESARALTAALPILQRARTVHVASWAESRNNGHGSTSPAVQFLERHGVTAVMHHCGPSSPEVGELLLSYAADLQADLLVMGCYGHGRAREWALGGATRTILQSMTLPVLMVH